MVDTAQYLPGLYDIIEDGKGRVGPASIFADKMVAFKYFSDTKEMFSAVSTLHVCNFLQHVELRGVKLTPVHSPDGTGIRSLIFLADCAVWNEPDYVRRAVYDWWKGKGNCTVDPEENPRAREIVMDLISKGLG